MNGLLNMLKAMGFDPDVMKETAKALFDRFTKLEERLVFVTDERLAELEGEIERLKAHVGLDEPKGERFAVAPLTADGQLTLEDKRELGEVNPPAMSETTQTFPQDHTETTEHT
jgi:hypothetical protein